MDGEDVQGATITAFLLLMVLTWLFMAVGVQLAGLLRPTQTPRAALAIMDPTGTAEDRDDSGAGDE